MAAQLLSPHCATGESKSPDPCGNAQDRMYILVSGVEREKSIGADTEEENGTFIMARC